MKRYLKLACMIISLAFIIVFPFSAGGKTKDTAQNKIDKRLLKKIETDIKSQRTVIVFLKSKQETRDNKFKIKLRSSKTKNFEGYRKTAQSSQKDLIESLKVAKAKKQVAGYQPFWLINAVEVKTNGEVIKHIAERKDVETIVEDYTLMKPTLPKKTKIHPSAPGGVEWNIAKIGATDVWDEGLDGTGVRVGIVDSGADGTHPDLTGKIELFSKFNDYGELTVVDPERASDPYGHGTHVAGIIAGGNASGSKIGVAPSAKLIVSSLGLWNWTFSNAVKGMQWTVDPDNNPLTDDGASVVNMSFGYMPAMPQFFAPIDNMLAAGVLPVVSIGNWGNNSTFSPGDIPSSFGVGATDKNDNVTFWSSGGVVEFFDPPYTGKWLKPDISAPGESILSAISGWIQIDEAGTDKWMELSGTSMAAPHVAGAAALLKQSDPSLDASKMRQLLEVSSEEKGEEGKDSRYGNGRLNIMKAVDYTKTAGYLSGKVTFSGKGIEASIKVVELDKMIMTDPFGNFQTAIPEGTYSIEASAYGYLPKTVNDVVVTKGSDTDAGTLALAASPKYAVTGKIFNKSTLSPIQNAEISVKGKNIKSTSTSNGSYSIQLPVGKYTLEARAKGYEKMTKDITVDGKLTAGFNMVKLPSILLISDFWDDDYSQYYKNILDSLGKKYTSMKLSYSNWPTADDLLQYKTVILASDYFSSLLFPEWDYNEEIDWYTPSKSPIEKYLDNGGKLFLAGQDIGYYLSDWYMYSPKSQNKQSGQMTSFDSYFEGNFLNDYLYVRYVADAAKNFTVKGIDGTIMKNLEFPIYSNGGDGANNQIWPDVMASTNSKISKKIFDYTKDARGSAAFAIDNGKYKVVYLTYGFEAIDTASARKAVMNKSLDWLTKDTYPPTVKLIKQKAAYRGKAEFIASAKDNKSVKKVEFWLDGKLKKTDWKKPYSVNFYTKNYKNGKHDLKVLAYDSSKNKTTLLKQVVFDNKKPKVSLSYPYSRMTLKKSFKMKVKTSDNYGIGKVVFYVGSHRISTKYRPPYEVTVNDRNATNGTRIVKAIVSDKAGNTSVSSVKVTFSFPYQATIKARPNPFSPDGDRRQDNVKFTYTINQPGKVWLNISNKDIVIKTLASNTYISKGTHNVIWNGKTSNGLAVKNGNYRLNFSISGFKQSYLTYKYVTLKIPPVSLSDIRSQPNPFSPNGDGKDDVSNISFRLNHQAAVFVAIYNNAGEKVAALIENVEKNRGTNTLKWAGKNNDGNILPNGDYTCVITAKDINDTTARADIVVTLKN